MAKWTMDLRQYAKKAGVEVKDVRKSYAFALYSSIVRKTPVDTGRARGNWTISVGREDTSVSDDTIKRGLKYKSFEEVPGGDGDETIYIQNNLPYIRTLEYGEYPNPVEKGTYNKKTKTYEKRSDKGFSKQAPHGMVGVTLANNENIFNAAVRAVRDN